MSVTEIQATVRAAVQQTRSVESAAERIVRELPPEAWLTGLRVYLNEIELCYGIAEVERAERLFRDVMREAA